MNTSLLLQKLIDIEKAIGVEDPRSIRHMVMETEEYILGEQRNSICHPAIASRLELSVSSQGYAR